MRRRIRKLRWRLWRTGGVDIVVTHAAPEGLGDAEDRAHWGFNCFRDLMDKYQPKFLVHGHVHISYGHDIPRELDYNGTKVINAFERYTIEIPDREYRIKEYGQVIYKTRFREPEDPNLVIR